MTTPARVTEARDTPTTGAVRRVPSPERRRRSDRSTAILEAALDCIVTMDDQGRVVEFNPASEALFGWTREEAVGRHLDGLVILPDLPGAPTRGMAHHLTTGEGPDRDRRLELPVLRRDGTPLVVELVAVPLLHEGRREFTGFLRDITELRRTQELLRASQARYEAIVRHSTKVMVLCPPDPAESTFLAGEDILGREPGAALTGGILSLVHPDDHPAAEAFLDEVRAGARGPREGVDLRLLAEDGRVVVGHVVGEDLTSLPEVGALLVRASDVTADREHERRLAEATAQMRALIDNLGAAVLLEDRTRHVLVANDAIVELLSLSRGADDLVGADCSRAAETVKGRFTDPEAFVRGVDECVAGRTAVRGVQLTLLDGRTLERDYLPIQSRGVEAGHLWVYRDVSAGVEARRALEEQNRSLAELAALKNEFVARVSHELRSPLTSVVSFAELLADPASGPLGPDQAELLDGVTRNSHRLLGLIEDLLLMAKLESHTLPLTDGDVDVEVLLREVVHDLAPRAADAGVSLRLAPVPPSPPLRGDPVRLQQVLVNVVGNAVAYTPAGGGVTVDAHRGRDAWVVRVADTGVGISADELPHVFDSFYRAASAAGRPGTGLGLPISRLIAEEHGGTLTAESALGEGTTMTVTLPLGH